MFSGVLSKALSTILLGSSALLKVSIHILGDSSLPLACLRIPSKPLCLNFSTPPTSENRSAILSGTLAGMSAAAATEGCTTGSGTVSGTVSGDTSGTVSGTASSAIFALAAAMRIGLPASSWNSPRAKRAS